MTSKWNANDSFAKYLVEPSQEHARALRMILLTGMLSILLISVLLVAFAPEVISVDIGLGMAGAILLFIAGQRFVERRPSLALLAIQSSIYWMAGAWALSPMVEKIIAPSLMIMFLSPIVAAFLNYRRISVVLSWFNLILFTVVVAIAMGHAQFEPDSIMGLLGLFLMLNVICPYLINYTKKQRKESIETVRRLSQSLVATQNLYEGVFENTGSALLLTDMRGVVLKANRSAKQLLNTANDEETNCIDFFEWLNRHKQPGEKAARPIAYSGQSIYHLRDGRSILLESVIQARSDMLLVVLRDITSLYAIQHSSHLAQERIDFLSHHDNLTSLPNREGLRRHLEYLISPNNTSRHQIKALVAIRLNSIRHANQQYGTLYGDLLIQRFAEELKMRVPNHSICSRMRSIVFGFTVEHCNSSQEVISLVEDLRASFPTELDIDGKVTHLQLSAGLSLIKSDDRDCDEIIHRCEVALEKARHSTNKNFTVFDENDAQVIRRTIDIEVGIVQGVKNNEFYLMYQPKIGPDKKLAGFEALLRWDSPLLGEISPNEFIPIAERAGTISLLSNFVIESACSQIRLWIDKFGTCSPIAINLSASDMIREDITARVEECCNRHRIHPSLLEIEITETGLIANEALAIHHLEQFKLRGVGIAIDDFGTGYSSLSKLSQFPAHSVKIDRSFVSQIGNNSKSELIIKAIVSLANVLGCRTVAEGVENETQELFLRAIGCEYFQGYLYHRPLRSNQAESLLSNGGIITPQTKILTVESDTVLIS